MKKIVFCFAFIISAIVYSQCSPFDCQDVSVFKLVDKKGTDLSDRIQDIVLSNPEIFQQPNVVSTVNDDGQIKPCLLKIHFHNNQHIPKIGGVADQLKHHLLALAKKENIKDAEKLQVLKIPHCYLVNNFKDLIQEYIIEIRYREYGKKSTKIKVPTSSIFYLGCGAGKFAYETVVVRD